MKNLLASLEPYKKIAILAEISCNHNGSLQEALELIKVAKNCGADAVKIQAYTPDEMTINSGMDDFIIKNGIWKGMSLYKLYEKTHTPLEWLPELFNYAKEINTPLFSSVFGPKSLEALEKVNCPAYKIASFELNDTNLIRLVAEIGKPMILSTGVATESEIDRAIDIICVEHSIYPHVMYCISKYPAKFFDFDLERLIRFGELYHHLGFSDHTLNSLAAQLAVSHGVTLLEKHLTLNSQTEDGKFSLLPHEFKNYVRDCKEILTLFKDEEQELDKSFKRSLYVVEDIYKDEIFTYNNVRSIRPGYGLDPSILDFIIGKKATSTLRKGTALKKEHIA